MRHLTNKIAGTLLGFSLLLGIGVAAGRKGQAQDRNRDAQDGRDRYDRDRDGDGGRNWDRYGNYGGSSELRQTALNAGYNEGIKAGREDRQRSRQPDYRDRSAYQKATQDYSSRLGDRELYRRYFREGFENGYNAESYAQGGRDRNDRDRDRDRNDNSDQNRRGRNWERYGNFGGSFQLRQTALNAGFNNGIEDGRKDRKKGERFNYRDKRDYQKATEDYSSKLGNKELYSRYFREGFENGYEAGYKGY
jgi:hypothetical protein